MVCISVIVGQDVNISAHSTAQLQLAFHKWIPHLADVNIVCLIPFTHHGRHS